MSYFACPSCGHVSHIFDHGGARREAEKLGIEFLGELPLDMEIRETSDGGALAERISEAHEIETLIAEASSLAKRWPRMPSVQKRQWLQGLIGRITLNPEGLEIRIRTTHLADILRRGEEIGTCEPIALSDQPVLVLTIAARLPASASSSPI